MKVYNTLGHGFLESVYHEALGIELSRRGLPYKSEVDLFIHYDDVQLSQTFRADFICFDKIIVEIKAVNQLIDTHKAQLYNYLRATKMRLGLLINFGDSCRLKVNRVII